MFRIVTALGLLVIAGAADADTLRLASKYQAVGLNPDGSKYTGVVSVEFFSDTTFAVEWSIAGVTYKGFGMRRNDALSATYTIDGEPGLIIYQLEGDGLDGIWAVRGQNGFGKEHLTPVQ